MRNMVLSILVDNTAGVLSRVSGLFSRRGYNIDSITAGITDNKNFTRMTVAVSGDDQILEQIRKQLEKLEEVIEINELAPNNSVCRELVLVNVAVDGDKRQSLISIADIFRAKVVDVAPNSLMIELTGNQAKVNAFLNLLDGFDILEIARTGLAGLTRGSESSSDFTE